MSTGERVRERMEQLGYSQAELARRVGISQPAIYGLINSNKGGSRHLHKIARVLRTTPAYLACETDDPEADYIEEPLTADERNWLDWLRASSPADRKALTQLARTTAMSGNSATVHGNQQTYRAEG